MTHELGASEGPEGQRVWQKVETGSDERLRSRGYFLWF